jgi:trans-2,3-dihydro-3-hydroxyanthranilate isomerase
MRKFPFFWVDAFTDVALGGNPCAVVLDADKLDDAQMLLIAKEMNLSETAFVMSSKKGDFRAKYFTPEREIPLAGHPTIATVGALIDSGRIRLEEGKNNSIMLELTAGLIRVDLARNGQGRPHIVMSQKKPEFLAEYDRKLVLPMLGLSAEDAMDGVPIQTVSTGTPMLMVPVRDLNAVKKAELDVRAWKNFRDKGDFFSPHVFCTQGFTPAGGTFARHLGMPPDTLEDPFTGSATGCMAALLWKYRRIPKPTFIAEQGHFMGRPGQADVEVVGPPDEIETVRVAGRAVVLVRGMLEI